MMELRVEHLRKSYSGVPVLRDVSFTAGEGVTSKELVEEARRVARNYAGGDHGRFSRVWRELSPAVYTLMGAGGIGLVWLIAALV